MKINRNLIVRIIEEQRKKDYDERGMQPLLSLGCFYDLNVENDEHCQGCRNYETCKVYLGVVEKKENKKNEN